MNEQHYRLPGTARRHPLNARRVRRARRRLAAEVRRDGRCTGLAAREQAEALLGQPIDEALDCARRTS